MIKGNTEFSSVGCGMYDTPKYKNKPFGCGFLGM